MCVWVGGLVGGWVCAIICVNMLGTCGTYDPPFLTSHLYFLPDPASAASALPELRAGMGELLDANDARAVCVCVCVRACMRACMCTCICMYACVYNVTHTCTNTYNITHTSTGL